MPRRYRRKRTRKPRRRNKSTARRRSNFKRSVQRVISSFAERKLYTAGYTGTLTATGAQILFCSGMTQGTADGEFVGNAIRLVSINAKFRLTAQSSTIVSFVRVIAGFWKDPDIWPPQMQYVLRSPTSDYMPESFYTDTCRQYMVVKYDRVIKLGLTTSTDGSRERIFRLKMKAHNKRLQLDESETFFFPGPFMVMIPQIGSNFPTYYGTVCTVYTDA